MAEPTTREMIEELEKDPMIGRLVYPSKPDPWPDHAVLIGVFMFERWTATPQMIQDTYSHRMGQITRNRSDVEATTDTRSNINAEATESEN